MANSMDADVSDFRKLEADLAQVPARALPEVEKVLKKGAQNLKEGMQAEFDESDWFSGKRGPHVSYERLGFGREIAYEIGPERRGIGSLAHIAVDGGANGGGGTVKIDPLLPPEAEAIERHIGDVVERLL